MTASPATGPLDGTIGAVLIGTFFSATLYGLGIHQAYRYARLYPTDALYIRILVAVLLLLETLQVIFSMHSCYFMLVTNYFFPANLEKAVWSANLIAVTGALIIVTSELFFIRRVFLIGTKFRFVAAAAVVLLGVKLGFNLALSVQGFVSDNMGSYTNHPAIIATPLASITTANILLMVSLLIALRRARVDSNGQDSKASLFIIYVVNTGSLVLLFDMLALITAVALPNDLYWVMMHLIAARVYMNTFLCVLNSRKLIVSKGMEIFDAGKFGPNILARANRLATAEQFNVPHVPSDEPPMIDIKITTEVEGSKSDDEVGNWSSTTWGEKDGRDSPASDRV